VAQGKNTRQVLNTISLEMPVNNTIMKIKLLFAFIFILSGAVAQAKMVSAKFDRAAFYAIIKTGNKEEIDNEINIVAASSIAEKEAYNGFLLMRKAGLIAIPAQKLKLFKAARIQFETALANDNDNAEYHFLRLIIEEKAPKIVKYNHDLEADKQIIIKAYKNLPAVVQQAIMDYSKTSKVLHVQDF
jgi:hypothetical protein